MNLTDDRYHKICDQGMDTRGHIRLNESSDLDLVFVIDSSYSVRRDGFQKALEFAKELVRAIATIKRYVET